MSLQKLPRAVITTAFPAGHCHAGGEGALPLVGRGALPLRGEGGHSSPSRGCHSFHGHLLSTAKPGGRRFYSAASFIRNK